MRRTRNIAAVVTAAIAATALLPAGASANSPEYTCQYQNWGVLNSATPLAIGLGGSGSYSENWSQMTCVTSSGAVATGRFSHGGSFTTTPYDGSGVGPMTLVGSGSFTVRGVTRSVRVRTEVAGGTAVVQMSSADGKFQVTGGGPFRVNCNSETFRCRTYDSIGSLAAVRLS